MIVGNLSQGVDSSEVPPYLSNYRNVISRGGRNGPRDAP